MICCRLSFFLIFRALELLPSLLCKEVGGRDSVAALGHSKQLCSTSHHHHMFRLFHHCTCCINGVFKIFHACHCPCLKCGPIHDGSIKFIFPFIGEDCPFPCIE